MATPKKKEERGFGGLLDDIISEAMQQEDELLSPVDFAREILGIYMFPAQRTIMKAFYGLPFAKGVWGDCIPPEDPNRFEKLSKWGHREDEEFDEAEIMARWIEQGKALWVPGQRYKNLSLEAGMGSSKCLRGDTLVSVKGRGLVRLDEILPRTGSEVVTPLDLQVATRFGWKQATVGISRAPEKVLNVRTRYGYELGGSVRHPVLVLESRARLVWKTLPEVKVGDYLCVSRTAPMFPEALPDLSYAGNPVDAERLARFMGLLVGDGSATTDHRVSFTTADPELIAEVKSLGQEILGVEARVYPKNGSLASDVHLPSIPGRAFLKQHGLGKESAYGKKVPHLVRGGTRGMVRQFLSGLFDTDGFASCEVQKGKYGEKRRLTVGLASASEQLIREVQVMLLGFGILSSRAFRTGKYVKQDETLNTYWTLHLYGRNAHKFFARIGFGLERKQGVWSEAPETFVDTVDKVPGLHRLLRDLKDRQGMSKRGSGNKALWDRIRKQCYDQLRSKTSSGLTYEKLGEVITYFTGVPGCEEDVGRLQNLLDQNLFFDQVKELTETHEPTYDLCVPGVAEFVSNGIVSHNSSITGAMSAYEFYRLTKMENPGAELGLIAGDPIFVLSIATNEQQAKDTIFAYTKARMESSAYFGAMIQRGEIVVLTTEIVHRQKNIIFRAGHSRGAGLVGKNLWGLLMDEVNRFAVEPGASTESSGLALWNNVGKGTTRFKHLVDGGIKIGIGSAWQEGDMSDLLWKQVEAGEVDPKTMMCLRLCTWDVNPNYSGPEDPDLQTFFASDPIGARRDYMGIRPGAQEDFFNKEIVKMYSTQKPAGQYALKKVFDAQGKPLLSPEEVKTMREGDYRKYIGMDLLSMMELPFPHYSYAHGDPGIKNDGFGFAIGHGEIDPDGKGLIAIIDFVCEWEPEYDVHNPKLKIPVNLQDVEDKVLRICQMRNTRKLSFDHWQSGTAIQRLYTQGIITEEINFTQATQLAMYETFRHRLDNGLVRLPDPESSPAAKKLHAELCKLQLINGKKIDHPKGKALGCSKDIADCVASVVYRIAQDERQFGLGAQGGAKMSVIGRTRISDVKW